MPSRRRDKQTADPPEEREMLRRRGRQMNDPTMEKEMCDLHARLEDMETTQRCKVSAGDLSDSESEIEAEHEEEVVVEDATNERLIRAIARMGARAKMDIPVYEGNLDAEKLLDWIRALDTLTTKMSKRTRRSSMLSQY
jgi:predicted metal-dependent phosphoesterase TrpH